MQLLSVLRFPALQAPLNQPFQLLLALYVRGHFARLELALDQATLAPRRLGWLRIVLVLIGV